MIDTLLSILGYTGTDEVITYLVVAVGLVFICCTAYSIIDFIQSLALALVSRGKK